MSQICPAEVVRGPPGVPEGVPADDHLTSAEHGAPQREGAVVDDGDVTQGHDGQVHGGGMSSHHDHVICLERDIYPGLPLICWFTVLLLAGSLWHKGAYNRI